ncbi:hypothetical protein ACMZ7Q_01175 [Gardnerella vaginalis]|uniref:hypothetical protein n=1 Tax=Gardnerella vaginalis TaxID=2702 RepID=UPI0039EF6935
MYNKDLNKANKANKGFMCKALQVVRYILLALIYNGVLLLALAWYRGTHSAGYTLVTFSALWFSVFMPFVTGIALIVFARGWRRIVGTLVCVLLIAGFFAFLALQDQIIAFFNVPVVNPWFDFTCGALLKIATLTFVIMTLVCVFLVKNNDKCVSSEVKKDDSANA